jgi:hypothetical protein
MARPNCGLPGLPHGERPAGSGERCQHYYSSSTELDEEWQTPSSKEKSETSLLDLQSARVVFDNHVANQAGTVPPWLRARLQRSACLCGLVVGGGAVG